MHKRLNWTDFTTLLNENPEAIRTRQRRGHLVLLGRKMGPVEPATDKREKYVYIQGDVALTMVAIELTREGGLDWSVAEHAVYGFWDEVMEKADLAEISDVPLWVVVYNGGDALDVGKFDELSRLLEQYAYGPWRVAMVNLTRILSSIRDRATAAGIELGPWLPEPPEAAREELRKRLAERRFASSGQRPKLSATSTRS